jgi:Zn-dependent metalloprotease
MTMSKKLKAKVEHHPNYNVPHRIYDIESKPSQEDPAKIAEDFIRQIAPKLQIKRDLSQLKFDQVKTSILGSHVLYQQHHDDKPITGAWIRVDIDREGKVYNVQNDLIPDPVMTETKRRAAARAQAAEAPAQLSEKQAQKRALKVTDAAKADAAEVVERELVYFAHEGVLKSAWKVVVRTTGPANEWKVYLDATTGSVLEKLSLLRKATGKGRVFDPNPVVVLNDTDLEDDSPIPDEAYDEVTLRDLPTTGVLDGPFVSTRKTPKRVKQTNLQFLFKRSSRAFKEVMVYFHIDRAQRHLQKLGFDNVLNRPIEVNVDGTKADNSFYSPTTKSLTFGTGGVDDAEDAEIILHEYGHAIQDDQVPGFGASHEAGSMGEGFGDFLAASFFADRKPQKLKPCVGTWDAVAYSGADPPSLRRLDSNKKYPKDMKGEVHDDGEIWSSCLWKLRRALGRRLTEKLVLAHHFLLNRKATFETAAKALITADKQLSQGKNETVIRGVFVACGILPNPKKKNKRAGVPFSEIRVTPKAR